MYELQLLLDCYKQFHTYYGKIFYFMNVLPGPLW